MSVAVIQKRTIYLLLVIAMLVIIAAVIACFYTVNKQGSQDLGTYENPEEAMKGTQHALDMLSTNVNIGIESVLYVNEYEESKKIIFKPLNK